MAEFPPLEGAPWALTTHSKYAPMEGTGPDPSVQQCEGFLPFRVVPCKGLSLTKGNLVARGLLSLKRLAGTKFTIFILLTRPRR